MIGVRIEKGTSETFDGKDAHGLVLSIQLGPIFLMWWVTKK